MNISDRLLALIDCDGGRWCRLLLRPRLLLPQPGRRPSPTSRVATPAPRACPSALSPEPSGQCDGQNGVHSAVLPRDCERAGGQPDADSGDDNGWRLCQWRWQQAASRGGAGDSADGSDRVRVKTVNGLCLSVFLLLPHPRAPTHAPSAFPYLFAAATRSRTRAASNVTRPTTVIFRAPGLTPQSHVTSSYRVTRFPVIWVRAHSIEDVCFSYTLSLL